MKATPKVNTDGLYLEDTLTDNAFTGVVPFYADPILPPDTDNDPEDEQPEEQEPEIAGYIVGVPVPPGLYLPRFDLEGWKEYQEAMAAANEEYQDAYSEWLSLPEELWGEGLTPEQIEALHPPAEPTELELLRTGLEEIRQTTEEQQEKINDTDEELANAKENISNQQQLVDTLGSEQVKQDLTTLDLKQQNGVLGAELVKKDISILDLQMQNQVLGQMLAALELKLLAKETGGDANV
ncbi:hypothetical protein [Paenibacillus brevis]|uniref:Uncharacterized protein n=1 Tax=Paenibacillus brevis TaxID=2841508 RepID=A0ABS6FSN4_9BACL|nr:hypothetical protein [Paenibacillus brevis]MBU5673254.1 hypothetical protein [Paenibacillus brevis]